MSQKCIDDESGNSEQDWEIFDILCKDVSIWKFSECIDSLCLFV